MENAKKPVLFSFLILLWLILVALFPLPLGANRLWAWSAIGIALGVLAIATIWQNRKSLPTIPKALVLPFLAVVSWLFLQSTSTTLSLSPAESYTGAVKFGLYGVAFYLAYILTQSKRTTEKLLYILAASGAAYALYGGYVYASGENFILFWQKTHYLGDVTGTFVNRNSYATYAGVTTLCALFWVYKRARKAFTKEALRKISKNRKKAYFLQAVRIENLVPLFCFMLNFAGLLTSHSRAGLAAFLFAVLVGGVIILYKTKGKKKTFVFAAPLALITLWLAVSGASGTFERISKAESDFNTRLGYFNSTMEGIQQNPLGTGHGTFRYAYQELRPPLTEPWLNHRVERVHNTYLQAMLEMGVPAALLTFFLFFAMGVLLFKTIKEKQRNWKVPLVAFCTLTLVAVHALVDFSLEMPAVAFTLLTLIAAGLPSDEAPKAKIKTPFVTAVVLLTTLSVQVFAATQHLAKRENFARTLQTAPNTLSTAGLSYFEAETKNGVAWLTHPLLLNHLALTHIQLAANLPEERRKHLNKAKNLLLEKAELTPHDAFTWAQLSYVNTLQEGKAEETAVYLEKSLRVAPSEPTLLAYRLRLGLNLWAHLNENQRKLVRKQYPRLRYHNNRDLQKIKKEFPRAGIWVE